MTVSLIIFVVSIAIGASAASEFVWSRFSAAPPGRWEKAASIAVFGFLIAIAVNWLLSWLHLLDAIPLVIAALVLALAGVISVYRRPRSHQTVPLRNVSKWGVLSLAPLLLWIAFVLWRGSVVPVLSHDALSYHLPKAVMMARAHHYDFFNAPDPRIGTSPANYELLLADVILLTGSDAVTEWIGTAAYVALLLLAAALAERWWGNGPHIGVTILLTAAVPVILLHAGAHKNDLLANVFYMAALLWGGRWLASQEAAPLFLTLASLAAAAGTKLQAAFPIVALLAIAGWLLLRRRIRITRTQAITIVMAVPIAVLLLGGWVYVANVLHTGEAALPASSSSDAGYGDWSNLLEVPLLLLMRPFDASNADIFVPWRHERWFWPRFELYFSDFGDLVTLLVLALPLTILRYAKRGSFPIRSERILGSIAAVVAFFLMLPIRIRPLGFFAGFPRYFLFIAVFVIAWTVTPMVRELRLRRKMSIVRVIAAACAAMLASVAINYVINDRFQPLGYVAYVARHPNTREPYFATYRAATVVDRIAGPTDTIAIDAGFDSWVYPLYGRTLQRKVIFINPGDPIPPEATFIVVDRAWSVIWGHPQFQHMGQYRQYLGHGMLTKDDLTVVKKLFADRQDYVPIYHLNRNNQAVFMRRKSGSRNSDQLSSPSATLKIEKEEPVQKAE